MSKFFPYELSIATANATARKFLYVQDATGLPENGIVMAHLTDVGYVRDAVELRSRFTDR